MDIGKLNTPLSLQVPDTSQDELGQPVGTFTEVAKVWGNVRHLSGLEALKGDAQTSVVKTSIRIRVRAGVVAGMRLVHAKGAGDVAYIIRAVLPDEQTRDRIDLACEVVA